MHVLVMLAMRSELHAACALVRAFEQHRSSATIVSRADPSMPNSDRASAIVMELSSDAPDTELSILARLHAADRGRPIVVLAARGSERLSTAAFRSGAVDYFSAPYEVDAIARSTAAHAREHAASRQAEDGTGGAGRDVLLGDSVEIDAARQLLARVARRDVNVLITGETGTGKELAAQLLHGCSPRRDHRFVAINCAAIPEALLESELFGHERGAFTGAATRRVGHLQSADGGTVFLDEVGDLGLVAQAKVLRALESHEISPLGSARPVGVDIRVVAATNHDLEQAVEAGRFRRDLYFRLNVARVQMPPLRTRRSDVHLLMRHYIAEQNRLFGARVIGLSREVEAALAAYDWPGNVRELRNLVEAACLQRDTGEIGFDDLPDLLRRRLRDAASAEPSDRDLLIDTLVSTHWNVTRAAERLQWSRMTIYRKMAKYRLTKSSRPPTVTP